MKYQTFANAAFKPSALGLGALHFGVFLDEPQALHLIHRALDRGINFIDTAPMYGEGRSEAIVGKAVRDRRSQVLIGTKVGLRPRIGADGRFGVEVDPLTRAKIVESTENSLRALGTDYIDLLQLHAFDHETPLEETLAALELLVRQGKARAVGCSNYDPEELEAASAAIAKGGWPRFVAIQTHYNLMERRAEAQLLPKCRQEGIGMIAYRALARGILTGKYRPHTTVPPTSRAASSGRIRNLLTESTLGLTAGLEEFVRERGHSLTELAIGWLLSRGDDVVVLIGARGETQLDECILGGEWTLTRADSAALDAAIAALGMADAVAQAPSTFLEK